jgi:four helix bundle protein
LAEIELTMSDTIRTFRDLDAWKTAMDLVTLSYSLAKRLPATERFELSSQMRRASASIPANIAEGQSCGRTGRYLAHVRIALGSAGELATHFELSRRLGFVSEADSRLAEEQLTRTIQLLHGLRRSLERRRLGLDSLRLALLLGSLALWADFLATLD